ncbi:MAG: hypothetical protein AMXMBFR47_43470 [Planctomycetota bacterium]
MTLPVNSCPPVEVLETLALGRSPEDGWAGHVEGCATCRSTLERIRDDNRFLSSFANGLGLPAPPAAGPTGAVSIPGYEIVREIHRGGQGVVYEALQLSTKRPVAVKVMKQGPFATIADRARFEREVETLSRLNHPNIVAVHDAGVVSGVHYFVMNYVDGDALDDAVAAMRERSEASVAAIVDVFVRVCDAVHAAHLRGIIHRDLKPSNIRVDRAGEPHVLDFGLAKSTGVEMDTAMTRTGQFVGSLPWASPEQIEGIPGKVDLRTDVYSLGAILYQLLTGSPPIDIGSNLRDALDRIMFREPQRPSIVLSSSGGLRLDDELDTIALKCLSKDRDRRYQSAGELARDLRRYRAGEAIEAKRDSAMYVLRKTLRRYRLRVSVAAAFLVMLVAFAALMTVLYQRSAQLERDATKAATSVTELLGRSNVEQGRMAGMLGNLAEAERLLWRELLVHRDFDGKGDRLNAPPGPVGVYWALLELYGKFPCRRTLIDSKVAARNARLADDGVNILTAEPGGLVWRMDEFGVVSEGIRIPGIEGMVLISPTGRLFISPEPTRLRIWLRDNLAEPVLTLPPTVTSDLGGVSFSPDGRRLAILTDGRAAIWTVEPFAEVARIGAADEPLAAIALSSRGDRLAARTRAGELLVWDVDSGALATRAGGPVPPRILHDRGGLLFSPDDRRVVDAWIDARIRIWDLGTTPPSVIQSQDTPGDYPTLSFDPSGERFAIGDVGGTLRIYDARSGARTATIAAYAGRLRNAFFTGDGRGIWTCGDRELRLWDVSSDDVRIRSIGTDQFHGVDVSPDGARIVCAGSDGVLHQLDVGTLTPTTVDFGNSGTLAAVAVSPDGRWTAAGSYDNAAFVWDATQPGAAPRRIEHPSRISSLRFVPQRAQLATACDDGRVRIWSVETGAQEREYAVDETRIPEIDVAPGGGQIAAAGRSGVLHVIDLELGRIDPWTQPSERPLRAVRYSPDGRFLLAAGAERTLQIWDVVGVRQLAALSGHKQEIYCIDVAPGGRLAATGDAGGAIRLWELPGGEPLAILDGHGGPVMSLCFAPDGRRLYSASTDRTLREWDLEYFRPHLAGQVLSQLQKLPAALSESPEATAWREWAAKMDERMRRADAAR